MSAPSGSIGSPIQRAIRPGRGRLQSPRMTRRVPRSASGTTGAPAVGRRHERAQAEGAQAGGGHEGALREEEHVLSLAQSLSHELRVGDALQGVPPVDGEVSAAPREGADQGVAEHLALGHEPEVHGQEREQGENVGVGGVVRGQDQRPAAREPLPALDLETAAEEPEDQARGEARQREREAAAGDEDHEDPGGEEQERQREGEPRRVEAPAGALEAGAEGLGERGGGEPGLLRERRARRAAEAALEVQLARRRAAHLAAGGLRHGARGHEDDLVGRHLDREGDALGRPPPRGAPARPGPRPGSRPPPRVPRSRGRVRDAEGDDAPAADPLDRGRRLLDLLGHEVAAALDDEVLPAAADVDLARRSIGEVPAVEPAAGEGDRGGGLGLPEVARGDRRPAEHEPAHRCAPRPAHPCRRRCGPRARAARVPTRRTRARSRRPGPRRPPGPPPGTGPGPPGPPSGRAPGAESTARPSTRRGRRPASSPRAGSRTVRSGARSAPACPGSPAPPR